MQSAHKYGYIRDNDIFLKAYLDFEDRKIGEVKDTEEATIQYFENRFKHAENKVLEVENLIENSENKGSYLMKIIHMRKYLSEFDGLGDFVSLFAKLDKIESYLKELVAHNRVKNLELKEGYLEEAKQLLENYEDTEETNNKLQEFREKWITTGAVVKEKQELMETKFREMIQAFYEKKKEVLNKKREQQKENVNFYNELIKKAHHIKYSDDFDNIVDEFKALQKDWKNGDKVPHRKAVFLWEKFKDANNAFFNRYKKYKMLKERTPDLSAKEIKMKYQEQLYKASKSIFSLKHANTEKAKQLLVDWKKITTIFKDIEQDFALKFMNACDKVFEISYLLRVVLRKYPDIDDKPDEDQLRIKISFMRELIRREEEEISSSEEQKSRENGRRVLRSNRYNNKPNRYNSQNHNQGRRTYNVHLQKRKLKVKKEILDMLNAELKTLA